MRAGHLTPFAAAGRCVRTTGLRGFAPADDPFWSWAAPLWERSSVEERGSMRAGQLTPFDAARVKGLLGIPPRDSTHATNVGDHQRLSSNCSLLEAQSEALVSRRKLRTTLQQTCTSGGARAGGRSRGYTAMLLHDRAMCTLYDAPGVAQARVAGGARRSVRVGLARRGRRKGG